MTSTPSAGPATDPDGTGDIDRIPRSVVVLGLAVTLGTVMSTLDTTIVSVGLSSMGRDLNTSVDTIQWVLTSYLLAFSMVIPLVGWAIERFGARRMWIASLIVFLIGSALCGVAWSAGSLIAFRVLQGLGGGMLLPLAQNILARAAGPKLMGRVMGLSAVPGMLSPVFGPVVGGVIVDHLHWQWLFYLNLPLGAVALVAAFRVLPADTETTRVPLDVVSVLLLSPSLAMLTLGFIAAGNDGFGSRTSTVELLVGVLALAAFVVHSLRRKENPLVDLRLFRRRSLTASAICSFLLGATLFGALFLFPLYQQLLRDKDAMTAGLLLAPQGLGAVLVTPWAGRLTDRYGSGRLVPIGMGLCVLGTLPYVFVNGHTSEWWLALVLLVRGVGLGTTFVPTLVAAYHGLERAEIPGATSIVNITQRVGGSIGTTLLSVILQHTFASRAPGTSLDTVKAGSTAANALIPAFHQAFWWTVGFSALAVLPALALPRRAASASHHG